MWSISVFSKFHISNLYLFAPARNLLIRCRRICQPAMGFTRPSFVSSCMSSAAGRLARYSKEASYKIQIMMSKNNLKLTDLVSGDSFPAPPLHMAAWAHQAVATLTTVDHRWSKLTWILARSGFLSSKLGWNSAKDPSEKQAWWPVATLKSMEPSPIWVQPTT